MVDTLGYPEEVKSFDFDNNLTVALNGGVFDIEKGTILKLAEGRAITHALFGFDSLSAEKIKELYRGSVYNDLKWPETNVNLRDGPGAH